MKSDTSRVPEGWLGLDVEGVYVKGNQLVVLGEPNEQIEHNCDAMGCGSLDHVLLRCTIPQWQAVEHLLALDGLYCQFCGELLSEHLVTEKGGHCEPARK